MRTRILHYILVIIFLLLLSLAFHEGISGYATFDSANQKKLGLYRIDPSLSFIPSLKPESFTQVQTYAVEFYTAVMSCKRTASLSSCIESAVSDFTQRGILISANCLSPAENLFYGVTEGLKACAASSQVQGVCSLSAEPSVGEYTLTLVPETGVEERATRNTQILLEGTTLSDTIRIGSQGSPAFVIGPSPDNMRFCQEAKLTFNYPTPSIILTAHGCGGEEQSITWKYSLTLPLIKRSQTLAFVHPDVSLKDLPQIPLPEKTTHIFCIPTTTPVIMHDEVTDTAQQKTLQYNFALNFD